MSATITRLAKKRGRVPALVTAVGILAVLLAQAALSSLVGYLQYAAYGGIQHNDAGAYGFTPNLETILRYILPFAIGVFVSLWVIAPVSHELTLRFVLTRAGLAALAGAVLVIIVNVFVALFGSISATGHLFGNSFPTPGFDGTFFVQGLVSALASGLTFFISALPLVMLGVVLLWLWLRDHPREYEVLGLIDEL